MSRDSVQKALDLVRVPALLVAVVSVIVPGIVGAVMAAFAGGMIVSWLIVDSAVPSEKEAAGDRP